MSIMSQPRRLMLLAATLAATLTVAACGSSKTWEANATTPAVAQQECDVTVEEQMKARGYPRQPNPGTLQGQYREDLYAACMRSKGFEQK